MNIKKYLIIVLSLIWLYCSAFIYTNYKNEAQIRFNQRLDNKPTKIICYYDGGPIFHEVIKLSSVKELKGLIIFEAFETGDIKAISKNAICVFDKGTLQ